MAERDFWAHLVAGGTAGLTTAVLTSPLDVLRTRLQSNFYSRPSPATHGPAALLRNGFQSFAIFGDIARTEGWRGFFRGLGPSLAGVVPATAIKFHVYGNSKVFWGSVLDRKPEENAVAVHALAAMTAGVATATATNPIWVVKTRLQLESGADGKRRYKSSMDCTRQILKHEGVRGLYKGLSASYLGTVETVFHLGLYEQLKPMLSRLMEDSSKTGGTSKWDGLKVWVSTTGAAGSAKLAATVFTYPHETSPESKALFPADLFRHDGGGPAKAEGNDIYGTVVVVLGVIGIVAFGSINSGLSQETNAEHLAQLWRRGGWLGYFFAMGAALSLLLIFTSCLDAVLVARADLQAIPTNRTGLRNSIASASVAGTGRRGFFGKVFGAFFAIRAAWNWTMTWITDMLELWAQPKDDTTVAWTLGIGWACCGGGLAGGTLVFAKATVKLLSGSLSHENPGNQFGHAAPIFNIIFLAITAVMQIVCLNRGLKVYESTLVVPVFYGVYTALGFLDSLIFNDEVGAYKSWTLFLIFLSIIVLISGVVLLTHKKPEPVAAKIKGAATPRSALVMEERRRRRTRAKGTGDEENQALGSDDERVHGEGDTLWAIGDVSDEDDAGQDDDVDHHLNPRASPNAKLQRRGSNASGNGRKRAGSSTAPGKGDSESTGLIATVDDDEDEDGDDADVEDSEPVPIGKGKAKAKQNRRRSMDPFHDDNGADSSELEVFGLTKGKHR
ncbi:hypothetical protein D9611_003845 [Ephemerocybe angulata]|uniref:Uncharacterized protein n=1 Tax=Ephemerocybe angulata TaxID=980116 RepID=A0A8H5B619_9AGAR|nr:hypothetical protein D9611_003845 [Tulosesus angulatus]